MKLAEALYDYLCTVADDVTPCPSNADLARALNRNHACIGKALQRLSDQQRIIIERFLPGSPYRRIIITATGKATDWMARVGDVRDRDVKRGVIAIQPYRDPLPNRVVDREPCTFCAVRGDIGCACRPRRAA